MNKPNYISVFIIFFIAVLSSYAHMDSPASRAAAVIPDAATPSTISALPTPTPAPVASPTATPKPKFTSKPTSKKKKVKTAKLQVGSHIRAVSEVKGSFYTKKGVTRYRKTNGKIFCSGFFLKGKKIYFANKKGTIQKGWMRYKGNTYFFDRKKGTLARGKTVEYVSISKQGVVKKTSANQSRVKTYLKAAAIVRSNTSPSDSKSKKLYRCYQWIAKFGYVQHRTMRAMMSRSGWRKTWDIVFANDIFNKHSGCCVSEAAAFALLAKECGYKKVILCCDGEHAWADIGGLLYDPLFAEARSFSKNYHARYTDYRIHANIKKKIS